jgi:hypothetical protein
VIILAGIILEGVPLEGIEFIIGKKIGISIFESSLG